MCRPLSFMALCAALCLHFFVPASAAALPKVKEYSFVLKDFTFHTGETLPKLEVHYRTVGNLKDTMWCIRAKRMKMRREHVVPLARQVVAMMHELRRYTGNCDFLFLSIRVWEYDEARGITGAVPIGCNEQQIL